MRALVNHANAWQIAKTRDRPTIIIEADFVPVIGFGDLPVPVPTEKRSESLAYLYAVAPQVWDLAGENLARGHGGGMAALLVPPKVAALLLDFFEEEIAANPSGEYAPWDARLGYWLKEKGIESYLPYRHYGEHGGIINPEHAGAGLGRPHRADVLAGRLAFLPIYAKGSATRFWATRTRGRLWGLLRLLSGRYLAWHDFARSERTPMVRYAVGRQFFHSPRSKRKRRAT